MYLSFPDLALKHYSLRSTGNRGIEAMHSLMRGGAANLPNLTLDFLSQLNKINQIKRAEYRLKAIQFVARSTSN